jgi:CheY-like chemotaxis protein
MVATRERSPVDVLIVDDDPLVRRGLRLLLEARGYACVEAPDGRHAVELARRAQPPCVLVDLCMPELDGLGVARMLRADPRTSGLHVHAITGATYRYGQPDARAAGFDRFLEKPLEQAALLDAVRASVPRPAGHTEQAERCSVSGLGFAEAERLLDGLERQGCTVLRAALEEGGVTVSCVCPPGFTLVRGGEGEVGLARAAAP